MLLYTLLPQAAAGCYSTATRRFQPRSTNGVPSCKDVRSGGGGGIRTPGQRRWRVLVLAILRIGPKSDGETPPEEVKEGPRSGPKSARTVYVTHGGWNES